MNYGYNNQCKSWKEEKKTELLFALSKELSLPIGWDMFGDGKSPYLELDGLYKGVRIRRITYISPKEERKLIKKADKIYDKIMGL